ncbi:hypothetical protein RAAC3_TM7C00001G0401 [Candidatus Saccharibacteria bacterium RAAC3_TM7_1]|nr:hypothetical protein RAAC3_TM7C00001G0401 [Candidatus Saccharibacteria bacterium RAAC3_TM7_1]HCZ28713.1 hypothetical protein [Candidatus Saccharibacteria bacterium]
MKVVINIFGPSTAGKSTVSELLQERIERLYTVDFDVIKRQLAGYYWKRDAEIARDLTYETLRSVSMTELPILALLPTPKDKTEYNRIVDIARQTKRKLLNIEITAPDEVLIQRYEERLKAIKASGSTWKFKTLDEFKEKLAQRYYIPTDVQTFDSSVSSPQGIVDRIMKIIEEGAK